MKKITSLSIYRSCPIDIIMKVCKFIINTARVKLLTADEGLINKLLFHLIIRGNIPVVPFTEYHPVFHQNKSGI